MEGVTCQGCKAVVPSDYIVTCQCCNEKLCIRCSTHRWRDFFTQLIAEDRVPANRPCGMPRTTTKPF